MIIFFLQTKKPEECRKNYENVDFSSWSNRKNNSCTHNFKLFYFSIFRVLTLIWNAIFSPKWRKNQRCSGINFFGLITCYRPGSNQIRRNLLLKTYLNNFSWGVNLVEFHFLLKFLNSYLVTPSENQKVLFS